MNKLVFAIIIGSFCCSTFLFRKAAGTLGIGKLNILSFFYYLFMLQTFAGISLIMMGLNEHYTLNYLIDSEGTCRVTFIAVMVTSILFPAIMLIVQKACRFNARKEYGSYLQRETSLQDSQSAFYLLVISAGVCILLLFVFLIKIGYVPLLMLIKHPVDFSYALERTRISNLHVIHPYVRNILILGVIPLLSYVSFSYAMAVKTKKWYVLAVILFAAAIIVKTYKFEKSPLLFHLLIFVLIYMYFKGGIKNILMFLLAGIGGLMLIAIYYLIGFEGTVFDIYNGPVGRTLFTQVGTLTYAFDMFPDVFPFLQGRSFAPTILSVLGQDPSMHLRSAKIIMAFYGSEKVFDGSAGVMNTVFLGEAYANFGYWGILFSILWVAFVICVIFVIIMRLKKTPLTIAFLGIMTVKLGITSQGGFCDFVYNADLIMTGFLFGIGYYFIDTNGPVRNRIVQKIEEKKETLCSRLVELRKR